MYFQQKDFLTEINNKISINGWHLQWLKTILKINYVGIKQYWYKEPAGFWKPPFGFPSSCLEEQEIRTGCLGSGRNWDSLLMGKKYFWD